MTDFSKKGALSPADLLAIWTAAVDAGYSGPLLAAGEGGGLEVFTQAFQQLARVSTAIDGSLESLFVLPWSGESAPPAVGANFATVTLTFTRSAARANLPLVLSAGQIFVEEQETDWGSPTGVSVLTGRRYILTQTVVLEPGDLGPATVVAIAEHEGDGYNNPLPGTISVVSQPGAGFFHERANVTVQSPLAPSPPPANASAKIVTPNEADTFLPDHVGQYVLFTAGPNAGLIARVTGFLPPDLTVPRGSIAILGMDISLALSSVTGTFQPGEPVTFQNVGIHGNGVLIGDNIDPSTGNTRVTILVLNLDPTFNLLASGATVVGSVSTASGSIKTVYNDFAQTVVADAVEASAWRVLDWVVDWGLTVTNVASPAGGTLATLDLIGYDERNLSRAPGEGDASYRARVAQIADVVTPNAIRRAITRVSSGAPYCFREVGTPLLPGFFYDIPDNQPGITPDFYDWDCFVFQGGLVTGGPFIANERVEYRDASGNALATGFFGSYSTVFLISTTTVIRTGLNVPAPGVAPAGAYLFGLTSHAKVLVSGVLTQPGETTNQRRFHSLFDYTQFRAFFEIGLQQTDLGEFGFAYDFGNNDGYDQPPPNLDFYDGYAVAFQQFALQVYAAVDRVRAGGVSFDLYLVNEPCT
jgi:hypothetical protein